MLYQLPGQHNKDKKVLIVIIEGSISDNLTATVMIRNLRKIHNSNEWYIVVLTDYPEIFGTINNQNTITCTNPNIDVVYKNKTPSDFYDVWAKNADKVLKRDIYTVSPHKLGKNHISKAWCVAYEAPYDNPMVDLYLTNEEESKAQAFYNMIDKPAIIIHPFADYSTINFESKSANKDWEIDYWQYVIDVLVNKGYEIIQLGLASEYIFNNVTSLVGHTSLRECFALIKYCDFFISIDTYIIHVANAFNKYGIVLWGRTNPFRVGYAYHFNIFKLTSCPELFCGRPENALLDCSPHKKNFMPWKCLTRNCMKAISPPDVFNCVECLRNYLNINPVTYERVK